MNVTTVYGSSLYYLKSEINEFTRGKDFAYIKIRIIEDKNSPTHSFMAIIMYKERG